MLLAQWLCMIIKTQSIHFKHCEVCVVVMSSPERCREHSYTLMNIMLMSVGLSTIFTICFFIKHLNPMTRAEVCFLWDIPQNVVLCTERKAGGVFTYTPRFGHNFLRGHFVCRTLPKTFSPLISWSPQRLCYPFVRASHVSFLAPLYSWSMELNQNTQDVKMNAI